MRKFLLVVISFSFFLSSAMATTRVLCRGEHKGKSITLTVSVENVADPRTGSGTVAVDGTEVAEFLGSDAKINVIFLTVKAKNARGEILEGRVTNLATGAGMLTRLYVPGYGIDVKNVPVTCSEIPLQTLVRTGQACYVELP
jgi:hypothetical protein